MRNRNAVTVSVFDKNVVTAVYPIKSPAVGY
nr:MAG TPA: hypothetical protein [Caudoviricetes sp.]